MTELDSAAEIAARCAEELSRPMERVFAVVTQVSEAMATVCESAFAEGCTLGSPDLAALSFTIQSALARDRLPIGVGVVADEGLLSDQDHYIEWLQRDQAGIPAPLLVDLDPASDDRYDYSEREWFRVPKQQGRRMVSGPYFDYRGTDRYALTFAVPVLVGERFVGVAGADVSVPDIESDLLPVLRQIVQRAALLNHERRVVTANTPYYVTGERVSPEDLDASIQVVDVMSDLGWKLMMTMPQT